MAGTLDWSGFSDETPDQGAFDEGAPNSGARNAGRRAKRSARAKGPEPDAGAGPEADREADPFAVARAIVLRQLSAAPRSRLQLARKLAERNVPEEVAEAVLDRFEQVQLIDDREFAAMWVRSRAQTRSLARSAIKRELADKGIGGELAEEALGQVSDEDEQERARALVRRKLRGTSDLRDRAERDKTVRRAAAMLARKGYPPSMAFSIVNQELDSLASAEEPAPADG